MSVNIATEVRRISDARSRLKSIIDAMAQSQAAQLSPDDLKYQTNTTLAQAKKAVSDNVAIDPQGSQTAASMVAPQSPLEPDMDTLKVWMPFTNLGKQPDLALLDNVGVLFGGTTLVNGPSNNDNKMFGGLALPAVYLDGYTAYCDVADKAGIRLADCPTGFSFCARIKIAEYATQIDNPTFRRTIAMKTDTASNSWSLDISFTNGDLLFHVKNAGVEYKVKYTSMALNTWYDIVATYAVTGNICTLYRNNVSSTTADATASQYPTITDTTLHIGRANSTIYEGTELGFGAAFDSYSFDDQSFDTSDYTDFQQGPFDQQVFDPDVFDNTEISTTPHSTIDGGFHGGMADVRFYNRPLTSAEVGYLYTNKFSISNIPYGATASSGYCISHS